MSRHRGTAPDGYKFTILAPRHPRHRAETGDSTSLTVTGNPTETDRVFLLSPGRDGGGPAAPPNAAGPTLTIYGVWEKNARASQPITFSDAEARVIFRAVPAPRSATRHVNARSNS